MQYKEPATDYFYTFKELSGSQRALRLRHLATNLHHYIQANGGIVSHEAALKFVSEKLGTDESEVRRGIVLGEGTQLFERTPDGLRLTSVGHPNL